MVYKKQEVGETVPESGYSVTYEQLNTLITFEKLWSSLTIWLRSYLISSVYDLANKEAIVYQLFSIPTQFYNIFRVFYGPEIAQQFSNLLTHFLTSAINMIEALKTGEKELADSSTVEMFQIADELARFLAPLNVYWEEEQWKNLLNQFISYFINEVVEMQRGNYAEEISIFLRLDDVTDIIGGYMARGIIARQLR